MLGRLAEATRTGGRLHASVREGDGEDVSTHGGAAAPRRYVEAYWRESALRSALTDAGWIVSEVRRCIGKPDDQWLSVRASRDVTHTDLAEKVGIRGASNQSPYKDLADYGNWGQDNNDSKRDTPRTRALFMVYLVFSGGRIPLLRGIEMHGTYFRPDVWVACGREGLPDHRRERAGIRGHAGRLELRR